MISEEKNIAKVLHVNRTKRGGIVFNLTSIKDSTKYVLCLNGKRPKVKTGRINTDSVKRESLKVHRQGDFAKLYRLVFGDNPVKRFSDAESLIRHFRGHLFIINDFESFKETLKVRSYEPLLKKHEGLPWDREGNEDVQNGPRKNRPRKNVRKPSYWASLGQDIPLGDFTPEPDIEE